VAELERSLILGREVMGLQQAKAKGKTLGRPRPWVDAEELRRLKAKGLSLLGIARETGISRPTVTQILQS